MTPLRALVVDDEPLARARLQRLLSGFSDDIDVVGALGSADDLLKVCTVQKPDVLFLDVKMPGADVFDAIRELGAFPLQIVFVTAFDAYAVKAFQVEAADYIVKPVSMEAVAATVERVRRNATRIALTQALAQRIAISTAHRTRMVALDSITHAAAHGNYVEFFTSRGGVKSRMTMDRACELLREPHFMRVHRSFIVRRDRVQEVSSIGSGRFVLKLYDGTKVTSGRTFHDKIRSSFVEGD